MHLAYDYTINGCEEVRQVRAEVYNCGSAYGNLVMPLEMVLNEGRIRRLKDVQIGPKTGDPRQLKNFGSEMTYRPSTTRPTLAHSMNQPWLTTSDWPVSALVLAPAK